MQLSVTHNLTQSLPMNTLCKSLLFSLIAGGSFVHAAEMPPAKETTATPLQWSIQLANAEIERRADSFAYSEKGKAKWDYAASIVALGCLRLSQHTGDLHYAKWAEQAIGSFINPDGEIATCKMED